MTLLVSIFSGEAQLSLSRYLLNQRKKVEMTQARLAKLIGSSQPRIAKVESGDETVSLELLMRAALATGATPQDLGQVISEVRQSIAPGNSTA